jgi:redox-sensing transcriptional repressor
MPNSKERKKVKENRAPEHTVSRLSFYLRCLRQLEDEGVEKISSEEIARRFGFNAAQIRKDLAYFGDFGVRGVGYDVSLLRDQLMDILGLNREWKVALFGLGNLGKALVSYRGFNKSGFRVIAAFDVRAAQFPDGQFQGIPILPIDQCARVLSENQVQVAIITVPATAAQEVADTAVQAGVNAILNFAPVALKLPDAVKVRNVDLTVNLENLSFHLHSEE